MSGHRPFRFPFQNDNASDDELFASLSMMNLDPPADDPDLDIGVRSFFLSDDDLSDDDDDGTLMGSIHQVNGPTAPLPFSMVSSAPQGDPYQQTRDALTDVVTSLLQTEQALSQHG